MDTVDKILIILLFTCIAVIFVILPFYAISTSPRNPCPEGFNTIDNHEIQETTYYKCCQYEIVEQDFQEECKILKALPSYWELWFG